MVQRRPVRHVLLAGASALLAACASGATSPTTPAGPSAPGSTGTGNGSVIAVSGHAHEFAVHDGDVVRGIGDVVAVPGKPVRFCSAEVTIIEGTPFDACPVGVTIVGADLTALYDRRTRNGTVRGSAQITGVFRDRTITVRTQVPRDPASVNHYPLTEQVPCDPPDGGWPEGGHTPAWNTVYRYKRDHPGAIVQLAELHPDVSSNVIYVLTAGDPDPVRAALAPTYGDRLCVQKSLYSAQQLASARAVVNGLITHHEDPLTSPTGGAGIGLGTTLQVDTDMEVGMIDDQLAQVVDRQPAGLVEIHAWLIPTS